ncbi:MAG: efflux transporter protein [Hyphomicrobiales bacterium]|nr:efflux transporter protein [Hyphomicrobiales bacterium]
MIMKCKQWSAVAVFAVSLAAAPARAADFYEGKTVTMIVGSDVGGGFDIFARLFARHLGRFIPGSPAIVVQNMPGAGSAKAAGYIYSAAPKDGTVIGALNPGGLIAPLFEGRNMGYEAARFQYLASADTTARVCFTMKGTKVRSFAEAQREPLVVGAGAVGSSSFDYAYLHKNLNGGQFKIVAGYKGMADILLALERGEVEAVCGYDWSGLKAAKPQQVRDGSFNLLLQLPVQPVKELDDRGVVKAASFAANADDLAALELVAAQQLFGRPYLVAPEVPAERVAILRKAFDDTMQDAEFLSEVERLRLSVSPAGGGEVQKLMVQMYAAPKHIVQRAKEAIRP